MENIPPSLSGAVNVDMNKLESIFKAILMKLDDQVCCHHAIVSCHDNTLQGAKIAQIEVCVVDWTSLCDGTV